MPSSFAFDTRNRGDGTALYSVLACALTWLGAAPTALAWMAGRAPDATELAFAGLSAFGPLLAALAVAGPRRELRDVFGHWRTPPGWVAVALLAPLATHLAATALAALSGAPIDAWFHPPIKPEHVAALVVFSIGEEFGWRGLLQPRWIRRYGPVFGSVATGLVWGFWHLAYAITPERAGFDGFVFAMMMIKLPLWSVIIGWLLERTQRSLAVALALHAGGHLDNLQRAAPDVRLHVMHILVLACAAALAVRALRRPVQRADTVRRTTAPASPQ